MESIALKSLTEGKALVIQKADKGNTVITEHTEYLERIKRPPLVEVLFMDIRTHWK